MRTLEERVVYTVKQVRLLVLHTDLGVNLQVFPTEIMMILYKFLYKFRMISF